jgi:hypothetical protein
MCIKFQKKNMIIPSLLEKSYINTPMDEFAALVVIGNHLCWRESSPRSYWNFSALLSKF